MGKKSKDHRKKVLKRQERIANQKRMIQNEIKKILKEEKDAEQNGSN